MAKTKVICTLKANDNITIIVEIEDKFPAEADESRIAAAWLQLKEHEVLTPHFAASPAYFRRQFNFSFG